MGSFREKYLSIEIEKNVDIDNDLCRYYIYQYDFLMNWN